MNHNQVWTVLYIILGTITIYAVMVFILLLNQKGRDKAIKAELKPKWDFLYAAYGFCMKTKLLKKYVEKIRRRIEFLDLSDERTIRRKTIRFTLISMSVTFLALIILLFSCNNFYFLIISFFTVYIVHRQLLRMFVEKMDNKLLRQFVEFLENVRHHYHEHGMIDESIYDSIEECGYEISLHANHIYEILTASDVEERIEQYKETTPNKFIKTFTAMCYLVQRFGDKIVDGKSVFLNNLNYLKQEINLELLRREKMGYLFKSLSTIAVFPIFTMKPLEYWAVSNIPELTEYYEGTYGFIAVIILFVLVFAAYQLIARIQSSTQYASKDNTLCVLFLKIKYLRHLIEGMIERYHYHALRCDRLLKKTGSQTSVNLFFMKQILMSIMIFLLSIGIFVNIHTLIRHNLLYSSENLRKAGYDDQIDIDQEKEIIKSDRKYILMFRGKQPTFQQIEDALIEDDVYTGSQVSIASKRISSKILIYNSHFFKWWELLISFAFAGVAYCIPWWMLLFRDRILRMNMEDEVLQFHTIILMLMHIERIHVEDILYWMEQFADRFKASITKCINNYEFSDRQALEQLATDEPYTPFVRIIENLQSAAEKITIEHAFDELITEREYYREKRKQDNEMMVSKKGMWGKLIAFIPIGATVLLYLIVPFILISATQLTEFYEEISKVL